ncbi:1-phosphofructokinase family hexose kinase [Roseicyclus persicicus]|uniref:Phosphofructokinase n=1 Tax=Roseicyclus persicicus TaxID=2650661 RepID=A0A7X6JYT3_9RHOB|nr:1-phosphofructokinase family hexose kinase [Roseibacterium persicicum]NKX46215.1 1-phosphofructokinase family hexose kinase [Roseibacterium persicicum]
MAILTVTLNPAIDLETVTEAVRPGEKLRCAEPSRDPGGGGINVARAIHQLGGAATALVAAGGVPGAELAAMLDALEVPVGRLPAPGVVRHNLAVRDLATGQQFRFILPGPSWAPADVEAMAAALRAAVAPGDWVVLSGSLPPGMAPDALCDLARALAGQGARVVADTSGEGLTALAEGRAGLAALRMNREEAEALAGHPLPGPADSAAFAAGLVARGAAGVVIVARGAEGSVLAAAEGCWTAPVADVPVVSRTGAGDSFVAAAVMALARGATLPEVLQDGCAAASAAVTTPATALCDRATMDRLRPQCRARAL